MISLPHQRYQLGQCVINCYDMTITAQNNTVALPAKVFEFLKLLILHPAQTVTKEQAIEQVWHGNVEVGKRGTGNAIWQLRKSFSELGEQPEDYFKTVTKVGYQLLIHPTPISQTVIKNQNKSDNKKPAFMALTVLFITCLGFFISQKATELTTPPAKVSFTPERITNFEGVEERAAISPDGRLMAFQWRREGSKGHLYIKDLQDKSAPLRQISMSNDTEAVPSWSPDGQSIAYLRTTTDDQCFVHVRDLISNQDKQLDDGCISKGYLHSLEWSPDGQKLAYSKADNDRSVIHLYHFNNAEVQALTSPKAGEHDLMMTWSADSSQLAVMRSQENMIAKIILHSLIDNSAATIVSDETLVIGLDWEHSNNQLYFTALRDANFVIQQYDIENKTLTSFHQDETISSITVNEATNSLYYARHISQEHITDRSLKDGSIIRQLISSSRDLYGQFLAATNELIFLSNRSGSWELWLKQQSGNVMLTDNIGMVTIPAPSPVDSRYVAPIKTNGLEYNELYLGDTQNNTLHKIDAVKGNVRYAAFSNDGSGVYYSSFVDGDWGLYRYDLEKNHADLLLQKNIKYAIEDDRKGIYYTLDNVSGIFYWNTQTNQHSKVNQTLRAKDWGSFFYQSSALYYLERGEKNDLIQKLDSQGNTSTAFKLPAMSIRNERSLASSREGSLIVSMQGINDADIYRIPLQ
ncbi:winged helix-turn-helix domain-containing protein [Shewanella olleyana]|uniref:winged helix-turn-helix domain-containing protein n=1 Tax=Shewanella olleyana TaxID=135626 RepID=UPI00200C7185|nr:winged helix-turn-helix domain-containing protein [Shewanella olleyana]MCL1067534.1 winged helix-turn-helix domain-containing protein [Shewanella olleyana]